MSSCSNKLLSKFTEDIARYKPDQESTIMRALRANRSLHSFAFYGYSQHLAF